MSQFILTIDTDNDVFHPEAEHEVARILSRLSDGLALGVTSTRGKLRDVNGNVVGDFAFDPGVDDREFLERDDDERLSG